MKLRQHYISVILTSYNHADYLRESIDSVLAQTYKYFELIIVDDCSSDKSWEIIDSYQDPRIVKIRHPYNYGKGVLKEAIFKHARYDYIAVHHSDDVWENTKLEKQINFLKNNKQYSAVFTKVNVINDDGTPYDSKDSFYYECFNVENRNRYEWLRYFLNHGNCLCHPSVLIKKNVYYDVQPFVEGLRQIPDLVMWIKICLKHNIYVLDEKLVKFRVHNYGQNTSGLRADTQMRSIIESYLMLGYYLKLTKKADFLKVFPEVSAEYEGKPFLVEYAFAKICLGEYMPDYAKFYGTNLLYNIINNPRKFRILVNKYNFDTSSFMATTGSLNVFKILPEHYNQKCKVRVIYTDEETEEFESPTYFMGQNIAIDFVFDKMQEKMVSAIQILPSENIFIRMKVKAILLDEQPAENTETNAKLIDDGKYVFLDINPFYQFCNINKTIRVIKIHCEMERMNPQLVSSYINK